MYKPVCGSRVSHSDIARLQVLYAMRDNAADDNNKFLALYFQSWINAILAKYR